MKTLFIIFCLGTIACNNLTTTYYPADSAFQKTTNDENSLHKQENKLIDSLYKEKILFKNIEIDSFESSHTYEKSKNEIMAKYLASVDKQKFGYILILEDTAHIYSNESFEPSESFKYIGSKLFLEDSIIDISRSKYINENDVIEPVIVWYGKKIGIAAKYYELLDRDIYLIRGINYYCNGSNCMNYKVLVIQKRKGGSHISVSIINFPGNYPYSFETTFLFRIKDDPIPKLYIIKQGKTGNQLSDFQMLDIK